MACIVVYYRKAIVRENKAGDIEHTDLVMTDISGAIYHHVRLELGELGHIEGRVKQQARCQLDRHI
jgi:hypothetical protein